MSNRTAPAAPVLGLIAHQTVLSFIRQRRAEFEQQIRFLQQLDQHEEEDEEKENANHSLYNFILDQSSLPWTGKAQELSSQKNTSSSVLHLPIRHHSRLQDDHAQPLWSRVPRQDS